MRRLLLLPIGFIACTAPTPPATTHQKLAAAYCECTATLAQLDADLKTIPDTSRLYAAHLDKMQVAFEQAQVCLGPVLQSLEKAQKSEIIAIQAILREKCPNSANNLELISELLSQ